MYILGRYGYSGYSANGGGIPSEKLNRVSRPSIQETLACTMKAMKEEGKNEELFELIWKTVFTDNETANDKKRLSVTKRFFPELFYCD